jgi:hypothetical protein
MDVPLILLMVFVTAGLLVAAYFMIDVLNLRPQIQALVRLLGRLVLRPLHLLSGAAKGIGNMFAGMGASSEPEPAPPPSIRDAAPGSPMFELRGKIERLEAANRSVGRRNGFLFLMLLLGLVLLAMVLWGVYRNEVLAYAVLDDVQISRDPADEGRLKISFRVTSPGKVVYRRTSGPIETEVIDDFRSTGQRDRSWVWLYDPGKDINVSLRYREGLWKAEQAKVFPTSDSADIVVLMDTTGSMSRSIGELKDKCISFSEQLKKQHLKHRFALIGFGDAEEGAWLDKHPFTDDPVEFRRHVESLKRFDGGDLPESALDALEQAVDLPFNPGSIRRVYLVTDAKFHEKTQKSGARAQEIAKQLEAKKVLVNVFSNEEFRDAYAALASTPERFQQIESFGRVLSEGRLLED